MSIKCELLFKTSTYHIKRCVACRTNPHRQNYLYQLLKVLPHPGWIDGEQKVQSEWGAAPWPAALSIATRVQREHL